MANEFERALALPDYNPEEIIDQLQCENAELRGAIKAQDERNAAACGRVGIPPFGCDTPEHLADEIEALRAKLEAAEAKLAQSQDVLQDALNSGALRYYSETRSIVIAAIDAAMAAQKGGK